MLSLVAVLARMVWHKLTVAPPVVIGLVVVEQSPLPNVRSVMPDPPPAADHDPSPRRYVDDDAVPVIAPIAVIHATAPAEQFVPPLLMGSVPVTSAVSETAL